MTVEAHLLADTQRAGVLLPERMEKGELQHLLTLVALDPRRAISGGLLLCRGPAGGPGAPPEGVRRVDSTVGRGPGRSVGVDGWWNRLGERDPDEIGPPPLKPQVFEAGWGGLRMLSRAYRGPIYARNLGSP